MSRRSVSEWLLIQEVMQSAKELKLKARGLSIGQWIKLIRKQLGMSQKTLAERCNVPQSTISRIESDSNTINISTANKVFEALSCDVVLVPYLNEPIDDIRRKQAAKKTQKQIDYLKGTMNLEDQQPDSDFMQQLTEQQQASFLYGSNAKKLWEK